MSPKFNLSESEKALFRKAVEKVKARTYKEPSSKRATEIELPELSDREELPLVQGEEYIKFSREGVSSKILRNLKAGQYSIEAILDLHGRNVKEAKEALSFFLYNCEKRELKHVLIIHGKGSKKAGSAPILKNRVNHWLRESESVLAFCSAHPRQGSGGALYVLLKKAKGEK